MAQTQAPSDLGVKYVSNAVIKMELLLPMVQVSYEAVNSLAIKFVWGI